MDRLDRNLPGGSGNHGTGREALIDDAEIAAGTIEPPTEGVHRGDDGLGELRSRHPGAEDFVGDIDDVQGVGDLPKDLGPVRHDDGPLALGGRGLRDEREQDRLARTGRRGEKLTPESLPVTVPKLIHAVDLVRAEFHTKVCIFVDGPSKYANIFPLVFLESEGSMSLAVDSPLATEGVRPVHQQPGTAAGKPASLNQGSESPPG
jgi:hypothetical protein